MYKNNKDTRALTMPAFCRIFRGATLGCEEIPTMKLFSSSSTTDTTSAETIPLLILRMFTGSSGSGYSWTLVTSSTVNFRGLLKKKKIVFAILFQ